MVSALLLHALVVAGSLAAALRLDDGSMVTHQADGSLVREQVSDGSTGRKFGPVEIAVGSDIGWTDGVCYRPVSRTRPGDTLIFRFGAHDVFKMASERHLDECDFSDSTKLAEVGTAPFEYTVTEQDARDGSIYFACSVGSHCSQGRQRLRVDVEMVLAVELVEERKDLPVSEYVLGLDEMGCSLLQGGTTGDTEGQDFLQSNSLRSECSEPELGDDNRFHVSCLSGPATLTPGGVMNSARILHYPYPTDRRVVVGTRTWEFVSGDPIPNSGGRGVVPVPVNQLYIHHLSGRVILGQGSEGIRRSDVDAPFAAPYGSLTGDEGELMVFHIIDLREVDEWLECVECRCRDPTDGTYLNIGGGGDGLTGGVNCCTNCTTLVEPTVDYRMRYNVSYSDIPEESVTDVQMLTADISPAVGKDIEFDVPSFPYIKPENKDPSNPYIQRLERNGPFNELFKMEFFGNDYSGPEMVRLLRCVGHLHIAALGMWLEDAETGEVICAGEGTYGTEPEDKGFLTAIGVESYDPPLRFPSDRPVRLITEYNATELHTGVMGMWFLFISSDKQVTKEAASLMVSFCEEDICDASLLPESPSPEQMQATSSCYDALQGSPACRFGGICSCEALLNEDDSIECGGVYSTQMGDIEINSVCAKHCDACVEGCMDTLSESPMCSFGGLCSCDDFVNAEESTGCGGKYSSDFGDIDVNTYCTSYCDACVDESEADMIQKEIIEKLEEGLVSLCKYATPDCTRALSNLYSCGAGRRMIGPSDPNVDSAIRRHGERLALKHAKLGSPSLHMGGEDPAVPRCNAVTSSIGSAPEFVPDESDSRSVNSGRAIGAVLVVALVIFLAVVFYRRRKRDREAEKRFATNHGDSDSDLVANAVGDDV